MNAMSLGMLQGFKVVALVLFWLSAFTFIGLQVAKQLDAYYAKPAPITAVV